jgi:hypothetical protein
MSTFTPPETPSASEFQEILSKEMGKAEHAKPRKPAVFMKRPRKTKGLASAVAPSVPYQTKANGTRKDDVKPETLASRPVEFPGNALEVRAGALYCGCCLTEIASGKTVVKKHNSSKMHIERLRAFLCASQKKASTAEFLEKYRIRRMENAPQSTLSVPSSSSSSCSSGEPSLGAEDRGLKGQETVNMAVRVHRFNVLEAVIESGVPVAKIGKPTNSAPPERAFSILNDSFEADQTRALADYKSASIMLQYNNRGRDGD